MAAPKAIDFSDILQESGRLPPRDGTARWMLEHADVAAECERHYRAGASAARLHRVLVRYEYPFKVGAFQQYARDAWGSVKP